MYCLYETMKSENFVWNSSLYFPINKHEVHYLVFSMCLTDICWVSENDWGLKLTWLLLKILIFRDKLFENRGNILKRRNFLSWYLTARVMVLNKDWFASHGIFGNARRHFCFSQLGLGVVTTIQWLEVRDATKYLIMPRIGPLPTSLQQRIT